MDYFRFLVIVFIYTLTMFQKVILNKVNTSIHTFSKSSQTILYKLGGRTNSWADGWMVGRVTGWMDG